MDIAQRRSSPTILLLAAIVILAVIVGGRTFAKVEIAKHFMDGHMNCYYLKLQALEPGSKWQWMETFSGPCAVFKDNHGLNLVIIFVIVGSGAAAVIKLITAFIPNNNDPATFLKKRR